VPSAQRGPGPALPAISRSTGEDMWPQPGMKAEKRPASPPMAAGPATPMGMPAVPAEEGGGGRRRWLLAGCGCLLLLAACIVVIALMDSYMPDTLYAPLRMLGF